MVHQCNSDNQCNSKNSQHQCNSKPFENVLHDLENSAIEKPSGYKRSDWSAVLVTFLGGCFFVLLILIIISIVIVHKSRKIPIRNNVTEVLIDANFNGQHLYESDWTVITRLYRGPFILVFMIFLLGFNIRYQVC